MSAEKIHFHILSLSFSLAVTLAGCFDCVARFVPLVFLLLFSLFRLDDHYLCQQQQQQQAVLDSWWLSSSFPGWIATEFGSLFFPFPFCAIITTNYIPTYNQKDEHYAQQVGHIIINKLYHPFFPVCSAGLLLKQRSKQ